MGADLETVDQALSAYALDSLEERMITRILEREDEGYIRWEPRAIYEQVQAKSPDLYPQAPPRAIMARFYGEDFAAELATRRSHRYMNRLPAAMLQDTIGRRIVDLLCPIIFNGLENPTEELTMSEARKYLKDALSYVSKVDEILRPAKSSGGSDDSDDDGSLNVEEAMKLIAVAGPERKEAIAKYIAMQLMGAAETLMAEEAQTVDIDVD